MKKILIRKALMEDLNEIVDLQVSSWQNTYKGIIDDEFLNTMNKEEIVGRRKSDFHETNCIVATLDKEIIGFCRYVDNNNFTKELIDIDSEIIALYVKFDKKRMGIGKMMFQYVINDLHVKGKKKMILWCLKDNLPARKFYKSMGGIIKGEHELELGNKKYLEVGFEYLI